jgi:tetratricopeptide (TPR) repeat protein
MRGGVVGRYVLLGVIGKGGMGIVYAAYDPELDRKVALKLLRVKDRAGVAGDNLSDKRARLQREAKAIARLSHPNVIVVYDVGTYEDQLFIAMELVDGVTVTKWRDQSVRNWREVLDVFIEAGEALAAAHEAGLVHRDFKPDNVMVTRDGKVRVMDFGLARRVKRPAEDGTPQALPGDDSTVIAGDGSNSPRRTNSSSDNFVDLPTTDGQLTHDGTVVGTPAYMPPEQYLGKTDARADQFSFCVALYESVYGQHPFEAKTAFGLAGNIAAGRVRDAPVGSRVPLWLRRILLRGIRPNPDERYPSMKELLEALGRDPAVRRRRWLLASTAVVLVAAAIVAARQSASSRRALCEGGPAKVAAAWELPVRGGEGPRHVTVRGAFVATGKPYVPETLRSVVRLLDDYATRWTGVYTEACEATQIRGEQSGEVLDLRMSCLNDRLGGLKALTDLFTEATGETVEHAVDAAHALAPLDGCSDIKQLRAVVPPPSPEARARVEALRTELAQVKALYDAGRFNAALERVRPLVESVHSLGYRPVQAEVMARFCAIETELGNNSEAEKACEEALRASLASRADDLFAEVAGEFVWVVGVQGHFSEAERWAHFAEAALERTARPNSIVYAWLINNVGGLYDLQGRHAEALEYTQRARDLKEKALGPDDPDVAISIANVALELNALGRSAEAIKAHERALHIMRLTLGESHPRVAVQLANRGEILVSLKRFPEARKAYTEALQILEHEFGPKNRHVADALTGLGITLLALDRVDEAIAPLEKAVSMRAVGDSEAARTAESRFALAQALWSNGHDRARALTLARTALKDYQQVPAATARQGEIAEWLAQRELRRTSSLASARRD